ncbi:MAG: hypothetical protein IAI49_05375, partial [Candidatus Eremiobacteraeota bacterium]|nr:hypothetical protein [Candidatus Eremiobacteraeota bacterium]
LADERARSAIAHTGLLAALGDDRTFQSVQEALEALRAAAATREVR